MAGQCKCRLLPTGAFAPDTGRRAGWACFKFTGFAGVIAPEGVEGGERVNVGPR